MAYKDSELLLKSMDPEFSMMENKELDFINKWIDVSVEKEVWRGKKLREEKPVPSKLKEECEVVNIDFFGSLCNENHRRKRKLHRKHKVKTNPNTSKSKSPFQRPSSASSAYAPNVSIERTNTIRKKAKHINKCSMRIAELAVPTKRQCIDTWRQKSYILPGLMVDRLKQHVMDQRPIVQIPEALYCFQKRRSHSSKKSLQHKSDLYREVSKPLRHMDTKALCIIFGNKIAKMLSTPLNLTLNSSLEHLSQIVASDIAQILKTPRLNMDFEQSTNITNDIANKVTVWIAGILEDLSFKLLEEDLKVKIEDEAKAHTAEQLVTIIEKILRQEQRDRTTELEEQEGPVLDFIDGLVDNVMNICEPPSVYEESDSSFFSKEDILAEESEKPATARESTDNVKASLDHLNDTGDSNTIEDSQKPNEILSDIEYIRNEIYNIVKNITKESVDDEDKEIEDNISKESRDNIKAEFEDDDEKYTGDDIDKETGDNIGKKAGDDIGIETEDDVEKKAGDDVNEETGYDVEKITADDIERETKDGDNDEHEEISQKATSELDDGENYEYTDKQDVNMRSMQQNDVYEDDNINNEEKNDSNVSEVFEIINEDLGDDKNSKKVKFSVTDLVNQDYSSQKILARTMEIPENEQEQKLWQTYNDTSKSNIIFAEPNQYLLSDADEGWPMELSDRPMLKLSDSISKSVTSLGNIFESDEIQLSPTDSPKLMEKQKPVDTKLHVDYSKDHSDDTLSTDKYNMKSQINNVLMESTKETFSTTTIDSIDSKPLIKKYINSLVDSKTFADKTVDAYVKYDKYKKGNKDSFRIKTGSTTSLSLRSEDERKRSHKSQSQVDYSWKVHPKTAPSWVISLGQGHGEPSEDSLHNLRKPTKVTESDMLNWCKDLEKAFTNLAMWSDWIDNTCKETVYLLKRKGITCVSLNKKSTSDWIRLKKNINKDAVLWTKLYQRTEDNFRRLKRKYNNVEYAKNDASKIVFDAMHEFDNLCGMLHRMIVSAEYCAMCTCHKARKNINTEYLCNIK